MDPGPAGGLERMGSTPLGLGCWALGGRQWGGQAESESMAVLDTAYARGIRHFDTAAAYGKSEQILGRFIRDKRETCFLASKVFPGKSPVQIRESVERSLERLGTDALDLCYLHWPRRGMDVRRQMAVLQQIREDGLIRLTGVSNYTVPLLEQVREAGTVDFLQAGYHLLWRQIEQDLLPYCRKHGIRVVTYSSLGQGILTGKFPREIQFPKGDHRPKVLHFQRETWPIVHEAVAKLNQLAEKAGRPLSHLALQWCARQEGICAVLAGARTVSQMEENAAAFERELEAGILAELTRISTDTCTRLPVQDTIFGNLNEVG